MYVPDTGATADAMRWGTGTALYEDLVARVKVALEYNRKNKLLSVCWMQGSLILCHQIMKSILTCFIRW